MKTLKTLLWSLFCVTLFAVSCGQDPAVDDQVTPVNPSVPKDSRIKLAQTEVGVGVDGGTYSIEYSILSSATHEGASVEATAAESWVKDFKTNIDGVIRFTVEPNETGVKRECLVTVSYRYADPVTFIVKQSAPINAGFSIANVTSTYFDFTIDIIPEDKTTPYIVMCAGPEYIIASGFQTGEDFYNDDVAYFAWLGQFYGKNAAGIMQDRAKVGDVKGVKIGDGVPGVTYTVYCYYIDYTTGALLSEVWMTPVTTATPKLSEVEFTMDLELVDGCMASVDVTPVSFSGDYYFDVLPKVVVDEYLYDLVDMNGNRYLNSEAEVITYWWSTAVGEMMADDQAGYSGASIIAEFTSLGTNPDGTPRSHYNFELLADVPYYLFAFAMEENGLGASVPQIKPFTTGRPQPSDNVITLAVDKVTARTAKFSFTATNNDYYVAGWEKASDWAKLGNDDATIMESLLHTNSYEYLSGNETASATKLEPDTEYVLYAFGSRGAVATTSLYTERFTTKSGGEGSVNISFKDLGYYEAADIAAADSNFSYFAGDYYSGKAIYPVEILFTDSEGNPTEDHGDWFYIFYDWTDRHESEYYNETQYIDGLIWEIDTHGSMSTPCSYTVLDFGGKYELVAVVLDTDGQFSKLYRQWINVTYDGARTDAMTYVNWWNEYQASLPPLPDGDEETGDDELVEGEGDEVQTLTKLFTKKDCANKTSKMSTTTFESKKVTPEVSEIIAR